MKVISPPTIHELLAHPVWKAYALKTPRLPAGCRTAEPYRVWGIRTDDKWAGKNAPDYRAAFNLLKTMLGDREKYSDAVIICRPVAFGPPAGLVMPADMEWCGHCRRPSVFRRMSTHVAMRKWPVISEDDVRRCYYCASRGPARHWHW